MERSYDELRFDQAVLWLQGWEAGREAALRACWLWLEQTQFSREYLLTQHKSTWDVMSRVVYALEPFTPPALAIRDVLDAAATISWNQAVAGLLHSIREQLSNAENCIAMLKEKAASETDEKRKRELYSQFRLNIAKSALYQQSIQQIMALRRPSKTVDENQEFHRAVLPELKGPQDIMSFL